MGNQTAVLEEFLHEGGDGGGEELLLLGDVEDLTRIKINPYEVSILNRIRGLRRFEKGKAQVEAISEKDTGKTFSDNAGDASSF